MRQDTNSRFAAIAARPAAPMTLEDQALAYAKVHMMRGVLWPGDATHAVVYNHSTWPVGWSRESSIEFFTSKEDLEAWISKQHHWARLEDNHVAYQAYEWDLGPNVMPEFAHSTGNLCMTYEEKVAAGIIRPL